MGHSLLLALMLLAQQPQQPADEGQWTFSENVTGSANQDGVIVKSDTGVGYELNRFLTAYGGVPVYFVHNTSSTTATPPTTDAVSTAGLGNIYGGMRFGLGGDALRYSSSVTVAAPTGDQNLGFSTGQVTVDWNNTMRATFARMSPYVSLGLANTVPDSAFFVRPFTSHGAIAHADGGTTLKLASALEVGGSLYAVEGVGDQKIVSRVKSNQGSSGGSSLANDKGFSTWLTIRPLPVWSLAVGYNRSATYGLDSVFFGVGFRVTR
jgi:hypothetical protein